MEKNKKIRRIKRIIIILAILLAIVVILLAIVLSKQKFGEEPTQNQTQEEIQQELQTKSLKAKGEKERMQQYLVTYLNYIEARTIRKSL